MKYATAAAFRTALEHRLRSIAVQNNVPLARLRKHVAFDRLLARLLVVAPDRWLLKGAVALDFRLGNKARTTRDLDLARKDSEEVANEDFIAAQSVDVDDFFTFTITSTDDLNPVADGAAVRYRVAVELAGRPFENIVVDIGFGDPINAPAEYVIGPDLLEFADIQPIVVPALPITQHIAEKVHAYTRTYGGNRSSSRVKDLIDIVLIQSQLTFSANTLKRAIETTFDVRATHPIPASLPPPPPDWNIPYRKLATEVGLNPDVDRGYEQAAALIDPVLEHMVMEDASWDPDLQRWA